MDVNRAQQIATRFVAFKLTGSVPANLNDTNPYVGEFSLNLAKDFAMKQNWRFDGLMSEIGRLSKATSIPQTELHEFLIEQILPHVLEIALTADAQITLNYSAHKNA